MKSRFQRYHPFAIFMYFLGVIILTCTLSNPFFVILSFTASSSYLLYTERRKAVKTVFAFVMPFSLCIGVFNMFFSRWGTTVLFSVKHMDFTKEALIFGINQGVMFAGVMLWVLIFDKILSAEKILVVFGKAVPNLALLFSMVLGLIPKYRRDSEEISTARAGLGCKDDNKFKEGLTSFAALISLSLEGSIETADAMRARGYGSNKRTQYNRFSFRWHDGVFLFLVLLSSGLLIYLKYSEKMLFIFDPQIEMVSFSVVGFSVFLILVFAPFVMDVLEDVKWHFLKSKI